MAVSVKGYCVKCKESVLIIFGKEVTMRNGRPAYKGECIKCGCKVYRILPVKIKEF